MTLTRPYREIRASFDDATLIVYQAFRREIAEAALAAGTLVAPFSMRRMTWIKPSFLWMAYRSGWASKEGQEHVLAIRIRRSGFDWALAQASLSAFEAEAHVDRDRWASQRDASPVRVQWDPERDLELGALPYRAIQIGLGPLVVPAYVHEWIVAIEDATPRMRQISALMARRDAAAADALLPDERPYLVAPDLARRLGMDLWSTQARDRRRVPETP